MLSKIIKCPHCKKKFNYYKSDFRPFCCERCKMIDLGHWFEESYTIAAPIKTIEEAEELANLIEEKNKLQ